MPVIIYSPIVVYQYHTDAAEFCVQLKPLNQSIAWQTCDSSQLT